MSAEALAARTDVLVLLESLRDAGARILPEVWHRATSRYITNWSPQATADVITRSGDAPSTGSSEKHSGEAERRRCAPFAFEFEFEVELMESLRKRTKQPGMQMSPFGSSASSMAGWLQ